MAIASIVLLLAIAMLRRSPCSERNRPHLSMADLFPESVFPEMPILERDIFAEQLGCQNR